MDTLLYLEAASKPTGTYMNKTLKTTIIAFALSAFAPFVNAAGDAASGEKLTGVCAACHGADGNSAAPNFPKLAGLGEKYILKQLKDIKSGVRPIAEMTGLLDNMSEQQLADMAAFYASKAMQLSGAQELSVLTNDGIEVDAIALGKKVYRAGNSESAVPACSGCHSPRGLGNAPAAFPRLGGQHAQYIEKQLRDFKAGKRVNDGEAKIMRKVAQYMTDAEIIAVSNFIAGLH